MLPPQASGSLGESFFDLGQIIGTTGKGQLVTVFILSQFGSFGLNSVLGMVRSLTMIVHLMMMQLLYPPVAVVFYSGLFEYVNYDIIPTQDIYAEVFGWPNVAYSEETERIGYESRYIIENSGSIPIYMLLICLSQLLFALLRLICRTGRIHDYAHKKQEAFFWAGFNDFINGMYLTMSFCAGINSSALAFDESTAITANNTFGILIALVLVLTPAVYTQRLAKGWNKSVDVPEADKGQQVHEGGELEGQSDEDWQSYCSQSQVSFQDNTKDAVNTSQIDLAAGVEIETRPAARARLARIASHKLEGFRDIAE